MRYYAPSRLVKIEGLTLAADVSSRIVRLQYDNSSTSADMFTLTLDNSDMSLTDSALLNVGKDVEIHLGYEGDLTPMMLGEITAVEPVFPSSGGASIKVVGYDRSHRMRKNRPGRYTFQNHNDTAIAARIAAENLLIPVVDPAPTPPRESVQQTGSDWALLSELAKRNFFELNVWWDKLYFRFPRPQTEQVVLEWGKNLSSFSPRLSTSEQRGVQVLRGYDHELAQVIEAVLPAIAVGDDIEAIVDRLGDELLQQLVSLGRHISRGGRVSNYAEAQTVAKSLLLEILEGLYEGSGSTIGIPDLKAGETVEIRGIGKRYSGIYTLSRVSHTVDRSGYRTSFEVSQKWNESIVGSLRRKIRNSPDTEEQESFNHVMIGEVQSIRDPRGLGRVQVHLPTLSGSNTSAWAPVATMMAGNNAGTYFIPDERDKVLVAFADGDINKPFVIGGFWDQQHRPPESNASGQNPKKVIRLKSGMKIEFDETEGAEKLELVVGGSRITLDSATGDIIIEARNNVVIKSGASGRIDLNP